MRSALSNAWGKRHSLAIGLLLMLPACHRQEGPSAARRGCLEECASRNDTCLLSSHNASQVKYCDQYNQRCEVGCPRD